MPTMADIVRNWNNPPKAQYKNEPVILDLEVGKIVSHIVVCSSTEDPNIKGFYPGIHWIPLIDPETARINWEKAIPMLRKWCVEQGYKLNEQEIVRLPHRYTMYMEHQQRINVVKVDRNWLRYQNEFENLPNTKDQTSTD